MAEWRHLSLHGNGGDQRLADGVSPELQEHINSELHREASILKEKRKVREERALARGGGGGGGGGGAGASSKAELQKKVQQQAAELKKLQSAAAGGKADGKGGNTSGPGAAGMKG
eukprot:3438630-Pyramimonas_sp.AAC.1